MEITETVASVNIGSPLPHDYAKIGPGHVLDNARQIAYIQPLIEAGEVLASGAYWFNKQNHDDGKDPVIRPGRMYRFWFKDLAVAERFCEEFEGVLEEPPVMPG
jgi:hypothetical protein